jgi:AcrR family transcriptional regulator
MLLQARRHKMEARRSQVAALWLARYSMAQIAAKVGATERTVRSDVKAILQQYATTRTELLDRETGDLEELEREAWLHYAQAIKAKDQAVAGEWWDRRLAVKARRAQLLGLNSPTRLDLRIARLSDDEVKAELTRRLQELAQQALPPGPEDVVDVEAAAEGEEDEE